MSSFEDFKPTPDSQEQPHKLPEWQRTEEFAHEMLSALDAVPGFNHAKDQNALLTDLPADKLVVRREDPERILELLKTGEPILLSFIGGSPYANSVEWNPQMDGARGLDNAYLEGFSHKDNVVAVYGFKQPEDFYFQKLDDSQRVFGGVDRSRVRAAAGFVTLDDIQFVTIRIPIVALPEEELTEGELDRLYEYQTQQPGKQQPAFIYRTYIRRAETKQ